MFGVERGDDSGGALAHGPEGLRGRILEGAKHRVELHAVRVHLVSEDKHNLDRLKRDLDRAKELVWGSFGLGSILALLNAVTNDQIDGVWWTVVRGVVAATLLVALCFYACARWRLRRAAEEPPERTG